MKRVVVLEHSGGLCNQLWNLVAIQAYCLERGYKLIDYASLDYRRYFDLPKLPFNPHTLVYRLMVLLDGASKISKKGVKRYLRAAAHVSKEFIRGLSIRFCSPLIEPKLYSCFYLPPSENVIAGYDQVLKESEQSDAFYLKGWLFRNNVGIVKHRTAILNRLRFRREYLESASEFIFNNRNGYRNLIGVHIRKGDFRSFAGGRYYFDESTVRLVLDEFLEHNRLDRSRVLFVICSDDSIDESAFSEFNTVRGPGKEVEDLLVLSLCDLIIGSNSSYGGFASYLGNVPRIIFQNEVDWDYYSDRTQYFEDKYFCFNELEGVSLRYLD